MLTTLQIENYALIEQVTIEFGPGFNVLTGETGSGKSIVVDALGLLLGERAEPGAIRSGATQATVTGSFGSPFAAAAAAAWCADHGLSELGEEIRLRREIAASGRSRAFVDHQLATLAVLRELARRLGEIHSQHEALVSFAPATQLRLLDRFAGAEAERAAVAGAYSAWREAQAQAEENAAQQRLRLQEADLWRFQADEIDAVQPRPEEAAGLERERSVLANAERIVAAAQAAYACLYDAPEAAVAQLKAALRQLGEWQRHDAAAAPLAARLESVRAEAADIADAIRGLADRIEAAPQRLAQVEERLGALDRLRRKYGPSLDDVAGHRQRLAAKLDQVDNATGLQAAAAARAAAAAADYRGRAAALGQKRRAAAPRLKKRLEAEVADLAMALRFEAAFDSALEPGPQEWTAAGWDRMRFLAAINPGEPLLPVAEIASGGELSRLLLALHVVAPSRRREARTFVLDEVDAGIGGRAAESVGRKLQQLGQHYQVLCVTHLPQIATFAAHHLHVEKIASGGRTRTQVRPLANQERVAEVARMLAGNQVNPTALRHAKELLATHGGEGAAGPA